MGGELKPWHQRAKEGDTAYAAFQLYLSLGNERNINAAYRKHLTDRGEEVSPTKRAPGTWQKWAKQFNWVERAIAHDTQDDPAKPDAPRWSDAHERAQAEVKAKTEATVRQAISEKLGGELYDVASAEAHQVIRTYLGNLNRLAEVGNMAIEKAAELIAMPSTMRTTRTEQAEDGEDGKAAEIIVETVEPVNSAYFSAAASLLRAADRIHGNAGRDLIALVLNRKIEPQGTGLTDKGVPPRLVFLGPGDEEVAKMQAKLAERGLGPARPVEA